MLNLSIRARLWLLPLVVGLGLAVIMAAGISANRKVEAAIEAATKLRADRDTITDAWFGIQQIRSSLLEGLAATDEDKARGEFDIVRANLDFVGETASGPAGRAGQKARFDQGFQSLKSFIDGQLARIETGQRPSLGRAIEDARTAGGDLNALFQEQYFAVTEQLNVSDETIRSADRELTHVMAVAGGVVVLVLMTAMALVIRSITRPLELTIAGFNRVANGDLGFQVEMAKAPEIARMTRSFNELSLRLKGIFDLVAHIGRGDDLRQTMAFIFEDFRRFVTADAMVLFMAGPDGRNFTIESRQGEAVADWTDVACPSLSHSAGGGQIELVGAEGEGGLPALMRRAGLGAALLLPMASIKDGGAVLTVLAKDLDAFTLEHRQFLAGMATQVDSVLSRTFAMDALVVAAVQGLAKLAESRDPETGDHLVRMSLYSVFIAEDLATREPYSQRIDSGYVRSLHRFAPMHDIGKVGIADRVLLKPGRLDDGERAEMNRHPQIGAEVLSLCEQRMNELGRSVFRIGIEIALSHHEKWDGSGYPHGLKGEDIPLSARIVAVADVFDALTSKRPYKDAFPVEQALAMLDKDAGHHFDPAVVAALHRCLPRVMDVYARLKHV